MLFKLNKQKINKANKIRKENDQQIVKCKQMLTMREKSKQISFLSSEIIFPQTKQFGNRKTKLFFYQREFPLKLKILSLVRN